MPLQEERDPLGKALIDYLKGEKHAVINVHSDVTEPDVIPARMLFRSYSKMSAIEKIALKKCRGRVLDVGAGSGLHSLYLQKKGFEVTAIDISPGAVEVMYKRGVKDVRQTDIFRMKNEKYDTVLMLMNGIGIAGNISSLSRFFEKIKGLLNKGGQLLVDSSDIRYMFMENDGSMWVNLNKPYFGEVTYRMEYRGTEGPSFNWLFLDYAKLKEEAEKNGFRCKKLREGLHYDYLARISLAV